MPINTVPLLLLRANSEIENIVATTDRFLQFRNAGDQAHRATNEALRYSHALLEAFQGLIG
jgi:hypothetical protein